MKRELSLKPELTMKTLVTTLIMALTAMLTLHAKSLTPADAAEIAADFFNIPLSNGPLKAPQAQGAVLSPYYVFNYPDKGWVIISGHDAMPRILAYGPGVFDPETAPDPAKRLLQVYADQYSIACAGGGNYVPASTDMGTEVVLETALWDQTSFATPVIQGQHAPTGCLPTALGIICRYHEWPERGKGSYSYHPDIADYDLSANFDTDYHIASLPTTPYNYGTWTPQQVADQNKLLLHLGIALEAEYGRSRTLTSSLYYEGAFTEHFGYMPSAHIDTYNDDIDYAIEVVKDDIDNHLPVLVNSAFVCDGYNSANYLHFNFGASGYANGFYSIFDMDGCYYLANFNCQFKPNYDFLTPLDPDLYMMSTCCAPDKASEIGLFHKAQGPITSGSRGTITAKSLTALHDFHGKVILKLCDEQGYEKATIGFIILTIAGHYPTKLDINYNIPQNVNVVPSDRIYLYTLTEEDGAVLKQVHSHNGINEYLTVGIDTNFISDPISASDSQMTDCYDLLGRKINPDRAPAGSLIITKNKKLLLMR